METTCDGCGRTFDLFEEENHASEEVFGALGSIHITLCGECSDDMPTMVMDAEASLKAQEAAMDEAVEYDRYEREMAAAPVEDFGWEEGATFLPECEEDVLSARYWKELELEEIHMAAAERRALYGQPFEDYHADRYAAKFGL